MSFYKTSDPGSVNRWRQNVAAAMRKRAAGRACPTCHRGNAMGKTVYFPGGWAKRCRYCGHEKSGGEPV